MLEGDSPGVDAPAREFRVAVDQLPGGVLTKLEREFTRARVSALLVGSRS